MGHIQLSREADLVVVCPATADLLAKWPAALPTILPPPAARHRQEGGRAPAMNVRMWQHAATVATSRSCAGTAS
jgi:phosphopantothenoylcysteine decarboxylase/phosphopantothenate--cysteine ligase